MLPFISFGGYDEIEKVKKLMRNRILIIEQFLCLPMIARLFVAVEKGGLLGLLPFILFRWRKKFYYYIFRFVSLIFIFVSMMLFVE